MEFQEFQLSNSIPVVAVPIPPPASFMIQVWFSCGARNGTPEEHGLTHCDEHMVFRGGRDFPDAASVQDEIFALGANVEAFTTHEYIVYLCVTGVNYQERAIHLLSDMLRFAKISQEDFEIERKVIFQEMGEHFDDLMEFSQQQFSHFIFGENSLGREILGTPESLSRFRAQNIRRYKERYYGPPNMIIAVTGPIDISTVVDLLENYFGPIPHKKQVKWSRFVPPENPVSTKVVKRAGVEQAHICIGGFGPSYSTPMLDQHRFTLLEELLSHRLFQKVRNKRGLVYQIFSAADTYRDIGTFRIYAATGTDRSMIAEVLNLIFQEMAQIKMGDLSDREFELAKSATDNQLHLLRNGAELAGQFYAKQKFETGRIQGIEEIRADLAQIRKDEIIRLSQKLWTEDNVRSLLLTTSFPRYEKTFCKLRKILR